VLDVVGVAGRGRASGEAATAIPCVEGAPGRGRHESRPAGDLEHGSIVSVPHDHGGFASCAHWLHWRTGIDLGASREKMRVARARDASAVMRLGVPAGAGVELAQHH
jgi:hypothetical protein